jgi:hypothetical protein
MTRVKRDLSVLEGIAADLKRFIAMHVRDGATMQLHRNLEDAGSLPHGIARTMSVSSVAG